MFLQGFHAIRQTHLPDISNTAIKDGEIPFTEALTIYAAPHPPQYYFNHLRHAVRDRGPEDPLGPKRDFLVFTWMMHRLLYLVRLHAFRFGQARR